MRYKMRFLCLKLFNNYALKFIFIKQKIVFNKVENYFKDF